MDEIVVYLNEVGKQWIHHCCFSYLGNIQAKRRPYQSHLESLLESVWEVIVGIIVKF